jgi:uncharacterized membrane protein
MDNMSGGKTALGLDANVGAMLCYLPICAVSLIYSIIVLVTDKENRMVRFHAFQSLLLLGGAVVVLFVVGFIGGFLGAALNSFAISAVIGLLTWGLVFVFIGIAIFMCVKAYGGGQFKLPVIGDMAEKWSNG